MQGGLFPFKGSARQKGIFALVESVLLHRKDTSGDE
jgi:hypothetical protein